jgi:hypothetical protein
MTQLFGAVNVLGAPGKFYLFAPVGESSRLVRSASFWILVILLPLVIIQFCSGAPRTETRATGFKLTPQRIQ